MMPREGTVIADRYRLERKVGGGRVAAVWRVHDEITDGPCAVKLLHRSMHKHPEALTRFALEERLARELTGSYFPERVGSGVWDGMRYIAWRWHQGESLRALFERNPKQDAPTVHSIVRETCQALALVHAAGYTHGDLKPENLLFADRGENDPARQLKLIGFGVASRLSRPAFERASGRRKPGHLVGTPLYSSPDLILGRAPKGGQADLWALAVIVYEALTGCAPFLGDDLAGVLQAILERQAPKPSSLADQLPGTFDLWWAQALEQEFTTPTEFATALARALAPVLRTSHTQRSASLPEKLPAAMELTPVSSAPARASAPAPAAPAGAALPAAITAAGLGPARSSAARAAAPNAAAEAEPHRAESPPSSAFAPLPTPLRDFASAGSRKTLVGIAAPVSLAASAPPPPAASSAKAPAPALTSAIVMSAIEGSAIEGSAIEGSAIEGSAIEGTPIKAIDVIGSAPAANETSPPAGGLRRPANPTVPFPRPRFLPRAAALVPDEAPELSPPISTRWGGSPRTLRFVLTSPDHKPQRIAAVVVCVAAALVIFILGRSPIAGTAAIGQATLAAEPAPANDAPPRKAPRDSANLSGDRSRSGEPAVADLRERGVFPPGPRLTGKESAPGLPAASDEPPRRREKPTLSRGHEARPKPAPPRRQEPPPTRQGSSRASPSGARNGPAPARKPAQPLSLPRKPSGELDFGI